MTRLARTSAGKPLIGDGDRFVPLSSVDPSLTSLQEALPLAAMGNLPAMDESSAEPVSADHISFASPLEQYGKLWGIGLNYADHAADLEEDRPPEPASFMKPSTAATGPGGPIRLPPKEVTDQVTAEAELAIIIGRTCSEIAEDESEGVVAGFVPVIDMTAEDILELNPRFLTRSKSFDSFLVFGRSIVTTDEVDSLDDISVRTIVNDDVMAENSIRHMMTPPYDLVTFHSRVMTLEPGDVISTGTPGAKHIVSSDTVKAEVDEIGTVTANVVR